MNSMHEALDAVGHWKTFFNYQSSLNNFIKCLTTNSLSMDSPYGVILIDEGSLTITGNEYEKGQIERLILQCRAIMGSFVLIGFIVDDYGLNAYQFKNEALRGGVDFVWSRGDDNAHHMLPLLLAARSEQIQCARIDTERKARFASCDYADYEANLKGISVTASMSGDQYNIGNNNNDKFSVIKGTIATSDKDASGNNRGFVSSDSGNMSSCSYDSFS